MGKPLSADDLPDDLAQFARARIAAGMSANLEDALRAAKALEARLSRDAHRAAPIPTDLAEAASHEDFAPEPDRPSRPASAP